LKVEAKKKKPPDERGGFWCWFNGQINKGMKTLYTTRVSFVRPTAKCRFGIFPSVI